MAGEEVARHDLLQRLQSGGYARRPVVEERGEFSVRGGIVDLFPPLYEQPVRLEFWGDEVESIRRFDPANQRSLGSLRKTGGAARPAKWCWTRPAREHALEPAQSAARTPSSGKTSRKARHFPRIERHLEEFYPAAPDLVGDAAAGDRGGGLGPP